MQRMSRAPLGALILVLVSATVSAEQATPPFPPIQVIDLTGQTYDVRNLLGTATVLNFWATWCGPCRIELPELQKLYNELATKGLVVLAIDVDLPPVSDQGMSQQIALIRPLIQEFLGRSGITLPVYLVDGPTQVELGIDRIPFSVLLDREGNVVRIYPGFSGASMKDLREKALMVLSEKPKHGGK
jgi:cytochrome c-type biogenesis protein